MATGFSDYCIYTIVSADRLVEAHRKIGPSLFQESKAWVTGRRLWQQALAAGVGFPVLLGDATDCSRLDYWGLLTAVDFEGKGTRFTVDQVRLFRQEHTPQELILRKTGKPIALNYIRPYAICRTPDFLSE